MDNKTSTKLELLTSLILLWSVYQGPLQRNDGPPTPNVLHLTKHKAVSAQLHSFSFNCARNKNVKFRVKTDSNAPCELICFLLGR